MLFEENAWLRKSAVKAVVLMACFSAAFAVLNLIPDAVSFIGNIAAVFNGGFVLTKLNQIITVFTSGLSILEKVLFLGLGIKALKQDTIAIPFIDSLVSTFID